MTWEDTAVWKITIILMKKIISGNWFFLTPKTSTFVSPVFLKAVQMMTKYGAFFLKTAFIFFLFWIFLSNLAGLFSFTK